MTTILDHRGQPIQKAGIAEPQTAKLALLKRELQEHPSKGLTPSKLARILEEAEQGDILRQLELHEDMLEKDGHAYAELAKRQRALLTVEWDVLPPPGASASETKESEELKERLEDIEDLEDVILSAMSAIGPAFSCQEIEWERLGKDVRPRRIDFRPQTWFTLDHETRSEILLRTDGGRGESLQAFGWITHVHRAKPGYIARAGLMRQLVWPYIFKTYAIGDLAEFLEIYGLPMRVGTYSPNATKEEKNTLLRAVQALGHDAAGIIPEGMKVEFQEAADGKQEPFLSMIELMERTESKVILGATLTSQADGKTSTNALGNVHNDVRLDILQSDARQVAGTLSRDLLYPIGMLNGIIKDPRRRPRLRFDTQEEEDFKTMAEGLKTVIVDMGMRVPQEWAYEQLGIPVPADGEKVIEPPKKPAPVAPPDGERRRATEAGNDPQARAKGKEAATLAAFAAAFGGSETSAFPDQAAIDAALDALNPVELQRQVEGAIAPIAALFVAGQSYDQVRAELAGRYPDMDTQRLEEALGRAMFVADLWGRITAEGDATAG
jgi:phage gp29-like protein